MSTKTDNAITRTELFKGANATNGLASSGSPPPGGSQEHTMLEDLDPETATEDWLMTEKREVTERTYANYETVARKWCEFCDEQDIESMANVSGRTLMQFKQ